MIAIIILVGLVLVFVASVAPDDRIDRDWWL